MGIEIIGLLMRNPSWATHDGRFTDPPKDLDAWSRYVASLVGRYKGRVHVWEIWNEPDIQEFWTGTAEDYVALLKSAYAAAKRADPDCLVMSAGLDGPGEAFLQRILQMGAADHCDLIGFHPYAGTPEASEKRMRAVWRILNFYKVRKPVWVTEVGWQSGAWKEGPGVTPDEETKARYLTECYQRLRPLAEVICWYADLEAGGMYGLARRSGENGFEINPAYEAYKAMASPVPTGPAVARDLPLGEAWNGARPRGEPLLKVDLPRSLVAPAGKPAALRATLTNTSGRPLAPVAEIVGLPSKQTSVSMPSAPMPPGSAREVEITLAPPPYLRAGKRPLVIAFFAEGRLAAEAALDLEVANSGPGYEVGITDGWVKRLDADGEVISPLRPRTEFAFKPGEAFRQSVKVTNGGTTEETFRITIEGPAAGWCTFPKGPEVRVKPGKEAWPSFNVRVPAGTCPGSHSATIVASSLTFPELQARKQITIPVVEQ